MRVNRGTGIALDVTNGHIYWSEQAATEKIRRADLDGGNRWEIPNTRGQGQLYHSLALDLINNHIYWTRAGAQIHRIDLNGDGLVLGHVGGISPSNITLDLINNDIYWVDTANDRIHRTDKDIIDIQTVDITGGVNSPSDVALDLINNHIYWVEQDPMNVGAAIRRANLDGTDPVNLILIPGVDGSDIALQITSFPSLSSLSGDDKERRRVPFRSKWLLLALMAALGGWQVLLRGKAW